MASVRRKKIASEANTSSSSDIAFLLLLFFVVTTQIIYIPVQTKYPNAREIERQLQSNILTVYIGNEGKQVFNYYLDDVYINDLVDKKTNEEISRSLGKQIKSKIEQDPDRNWLVSLRIDADVDFDTINTLITDLQNNSVESIVFEARKRG